MDQASSVILKQVTKLIDEIIKYDEELTEYEYNTLEEVMMVLNKFR